MDNSAGSGARGSRLGVFFHRHPTMGTTAHAERCRGHIYRPLLVWHQSNDYVIRSVRPGHPDYGQGTTAPAGNHSLPRNPDAPLCRRDNEHVLSFTVRPVLRTATCGQVRGLRNFDGGDARHSRTRWTLNKGPEMRPNPAHALDGGIPSLFHTGHRWPAASDEHRSATLRA